MWLEMQSRASDRSLVESRAERNKKHNKEEKQDDVQTVRTTLYISFK